MNVDVPLNLFDSLFCGQLVESGNPFLLRRQTLLFLLLFSIIVAVGILKVDIKYLRLKLA